MYWGRVGGDGVMRVQVYDGEIHGRYAFVRLLDGCGRPEWRFPESDVLQLQLRDSQFRVVKVLHEVALPASWVKRVRKVSEQDWIEITSITNSYGIN